MHLGEPSYSDVYARLGHQIGSSMAMSANLLQFDDDIELADSDLEEQARARYRDRYWWVRLDTHPRESVTGATLLARADLESVRVGEAEQPGISTGSLEDRREHTIDSLQTDWSWRLRARRSCSSAESGGAARGSYRYQDEAEFDLVFDVPGLQSEDSRANMLDVHRRGDQYGAYASLRVEVGRAAHRGRRPALGSFDAEQRRRALESARERALSAWRCHVLACELGSLRSGDEHRGVAGLGRRYEFAHAQRAEHWLLELRAAVERGRETCASRAYHKRYTDLAAALREPAQSPGDSAGGESPIACGSTP